MARSRNNQVSDFLSTFGQAYGLSRRVASDRALSQAIESQPETTQQFTPEQGQQLAQMAQQDPYFAFDEKAGGYTSQVIPAGQTGPMAPVRPQAMTTFLGKTYQGELTPQQVTSARFNAAADAVAKYDPERALQLRGRAQELDMAQQRFGMEKERNERDKTLFGLQVKGLERTERKAQEADAGDDLLRKSLAEYTGSEDQVGATAQYLNTNSQRITMGTPDKDGLIQLSVVRPDGRAEFVSLPRQQQATLYAAAQLMNTQPERALTMMAGVNKSLAEAVAQENGINLKLADSTNSVADKRIGRDLQQQGLQLQREAKGEQARHNRAMEGISAARASASGGGKPVKMDVATVDPVTGRSSKVQVLFNPKDGTARTADGKPFTDQAALDRSLGRMDAAARLDANQAHDMQLLEAAVKGGQVPYQDLAKERQKIISGYEQQRIRMDFADSGPDEQRAFVAELLAAGETVPSVAVKLGVPAQQIQAVAPAAGRQSALPPRMVKPQTPASEPKWHTGAYDTPYARQKAAEAEQFVDPYTKRQAVRLLPSGRPMLAPAD